MNDSNSVDDFFEDGLPAGFHAEDGFVNLDDAKFNYFSKYSDEQLDRIYEAEPSARDVIDKIRRIRS